MESQDSTNSKAVDWQAKYQKEHELKKKFNKRNKKNVKKIKRLNQRVNKLKAKLTQLETKSFIREHDYF